MAEGEKIKTTIYMTTDTWDRLVQFMREKYGRDTKATSITIEEAVKEYLDARDAREAPVSA